MLHPCSPNKATVARATPTESLLQVHHAGPSEYSFQCEVCCGRGSFEDRPTVQRSRHCPARCGPVSFNCAYCGCWKGLEDRVTCQWCGYSPLCLFRCAIPYAKRCRDHCERYKPPSVAPSSYPDPAHGFRRTHCQLFRRTTRMCAICGDSGSDLACPHPFVARKSCEC